MNVEQIISELRAELELIDEVILALKRGVSAKRRRLRRQSGSASVGSVRTARAQSTSPLSQRIMKAGSETV
jgi:hypothetical protein